MEVTLHRSPSAAERQRLRSPVDAAEQAPAAACAHLANRLHRRSPDLVATFFMPPVPLGQVVPVAGVLVGEGEGEEGEGEGDSIMGLGIRLLGLGIMLRGLGIMLRGLGIMLLGWGCDRWMV